MWCIHNPAKLGPYVVAIAVGLGIAVSAQDQPSESPRIQPATVKDGGIEVYGLIRKLGEHPTEDGTVLAVQVTAADSNATTQLRREADGEPCANCTTTHYFLVREPGDERPKMLIRMAPGPVTYIHIAGKEYMLWDVRLTWPQDGEPRLERVTLAQTGFAPPPLKRKKRLRFGPPVTAQPLIDDISWMAMRDAMEQRRLAERAYEAAVQEHGQASDE